MKALTTISDLRTQTREHSFFRSFIRHNTRVPVSMLNSDSKGFLWNLIIFSVARHFRLWLPVVLQPASIADLYLSVAFLTLSSLLSAGLSRSSVLLSIHRAVVLKRLQQQLSPSLVYPSLRHQHHHLSSYPLATAKGVQMSSSSSSPSSSTATASPPPFPPTYPSNRWSYFPRESSQLTEVFKASPSKISFTHSPKPLHPYDSLTLHIEDSATAEVLQAAANLLRNAKCVAFPTETVYGLGADACNTAGVKSIFSAKQRPLDNPLIVHVSSLRQLRELLPPAPPSTGSTPSSFSSLVLDGSSSKESPNACREGIIPEVYSPLIAKFWPGPLTILLPFPDNSRLSPSVTAGQPTFAARLPEHPIALALCSLSGLPLAAPSANASGNPSPTTAAHVYTDLRGRIPFIIDGGSSNVGVESTVIDGLRYPPVILRPGGISLEQIRACGGIWKDVIVRNPDAEDHDAAPQAPGMKYKHYSPRAGVVLFEYGAKPPTHSNIRPMGKAGNGWSGKVGFLRTRTWPVGVGTNTLGDAETDKKWIVYERSLGTEGSDISRALFAGLRELDDLNVDVIYVEGIEEKDEGLAVMNRLRKAASVVVRNVS